MSKPPKLCECGEPLTFPGTTLCMDCQIRKNRYAERAYVPLFGVVEKRLPNVGTCLRHRKRGCILCLGDDK